MNVIFLDFDGPMFPTKVCLLPQNNELENEAKRREIGLNVELYSLWKMDDYAILYLKKLYQYMPFEIVVSSNWGNGCSREVIQKLFDANDIDIPLAQDYNLARMEASRLERIAEYIVRNKVRNYLVIDDIDSCPDIIDEKAILKANLIKENMFSIDFNEGISLQNFKDMRTLICNWK